MKLVSVETPEKSVCKMTFSATAEELETASNAVYERTRASYTIKGFAKGEADRAQIEADRGEHTFWYDAINDLMDKDVPALYDAAMKEHGFKPVDEPSYDLVSVKKDEGFVATATTALQPELTLTQTTGFKVECVTPAVTAAPLRPSWCPTRVPPSKATSSTWTTKVCWTAKPSRAAPPRTRPCSWAAAG